MRLKGFRTDAADAPPRHGQGRGLTADECATVLATCLRPRGLERPKTAERRGLVDGAIVALLFHGALRRSEVAALCWADVDFRDGDDVVVTVRRSKSDPTGGCADVRRLVGGCASALRRLHAAVSPEPGIRRPAQRGAERQRALPPKRRVVAVAARKAVRRGPHAERRPEGEAVNRRWMYITAVQIRPAKALLASSKRVNTSGRRSVNVI